MTNRDKVNIDSNDMVIREGFRYPDEEVLNKLGKGDACSFTPFLPDNVPAMLFITLNGMAQMEEDNFNNGHIKTGLFIRGAGMYVVFNIGGVEFECPINIHLLRGKHYLPEVTDQMRLLVNLVAMESGTGIVRALRTFTLHPTFSENLVKEAVDQLEKTHPYQVEEDNYGIEITIPQGLMGASCRFYEAGV